MAKDNDDPRFDTRSAQVKAHLCHQVLDGNSLVYTHGGELGCADADDTCTGDEFS